jgi:Mrp family chromosome partitioning ATPase
VERIAKAVELARQASGVHGEEPFRVPERSSHVAASEVQYTRTRRVSASPEALGAHHVTGGQERTPLAESFKRIRTQVLQRLREGGRSTLGIASPRTGEGKTTVALNLAVHTAVQPDWTVLVVEADLHHPGVSQALGLGALPGLTDYLLNDVPLEKLLIHAGLGRCVLLPAGAPVAGSSEALGSARMRELALEVKHRYPDRLVIFDLPPLLEAADGLAVLPWVETLLLVVEEGRTASDDVLRCAQLVGDDRLLGTVLNKSQVAVSAPGQKPGFLRRLLTGAQ